MKHAQFCPIAKASEVIGERWMLLVIRELLAGATGFTELQRGLRSISPSVLSSRLRTLVEHGIIERVAADSAKGRYQLTQAGQELGPIIASVGTWGRRWVRSRMTRDELDVELLMLHIGRSSDASAFPKKHAVIGFVFGDLHGRARHWWLRLTGGEAELCAEFPGRAEDVTLSCKVRTMAEVFSGDIPVKVAVAEGSLRLEGLPKLTHSVQRCLRISPFANVQLPEPQLAAVR